MMVPARPCSSAGPASAAASAPSPRTARRPLLGVNVDQVILLTFLIGGLMAGGAAFLYMIYLPAHPLQRRLPARHQGVHRRRPGRHRQPQGALLGGLLLGVVENWGAGLFGGKWQDVIAFVLL